MALEFAFFGLFVLLSIGGGFLLLQFIWAEDESSEATDWESGRRRARKDTHDERD